MESVLMSIVIVALVAIAAVVAIVAIVFHRSFIAWISRKGIHIETGKSDEDKGLE